MQNIFQDLKRREQQGLPVRVGIVGAGFMGAGSLRQISRVPGMVAPIVANRTLSRAVDAFIAAGVARADIVTTDDVDTARKAVERGRCVATSRLDLPAFIPSLDVVMETTGNVVAGTDVTLKALRQGKHVVAANLEVQGTVGPILKARADAAGVVYTDCDGDQPGIIMNLHAYCAGLGLEPLVAGNCKGVLKRYATPETQAAFAREYGISATIATSAADGTKINLEMAAVANATGMLPLRTGMLGLQTRLETLLDDCRGAGLLDGPPAVEYTLGIPSGVFIIARTDDPSLQRDFRYLKMGDGPEYIFYESRVVCHFDAPVTIAKAALYGAATVTPRGRPVAEVIALAKRPLEAGTRLD